MLRRTELKLWALRARSSGGKIWHIERHVSAETSEKWLSLFIKDEPNISFIISVKKPKITVVT